MGHKIVLIGDIKADLIYASDFQGLHGPLDYLQCVQRIESFKKGVNEFQCQEYIQLMERLEVERRYNESIQSAAENLLKSFKELPSSFIPEVIITPPTNNRHLQMPTLERFQKEFKMLDLSRYFTKVGVEIKLLEEIPQIDTIERILIIDDVYATGKTVEKIVLNLKGTQHKRFVIICPLYVEQQSSL